jgi:hypothetical protein
MNNNFKDILESGASYMDRMDGHPADQLQKAKLIYKRLENEIIRVAALATVDADGSIPPTTKEELLRL